MKKATKKPLETTSELKRARDLTTIVELFSVFPWSVVEHVLREALDNRIHADHTDCLFSAEKYRGTTLFHLYDQRLEQQLADFFNVWNAAWEIGETTHIDRTYNGVWTPLLDDCTPVTPEIKAKYKAFAAHLNKALDALSGIAKHLNSVYPEFSIIESDNEACRRYREMVEKDDIYFKELWSNPHSDEEGTQEERIACFAKEHLKHESNEQKLIDAMLGGERKMEVLKSTLFGFEGSASKKFSSLWKTVSKKMEKEIKVGIKRKVHVLEFWSRESLG